MHLYRRRADRWAALVYLAPAFLFLGVYIAYPILSTLYYSLFQWSGLSSRRVLVGLGNFAHLLRDPVVGAALFHNLVFLVFGLAVVLPFAFLVAILLVRRAGAKQRVLRTIYFFPVVLNLVVVGTVWGLFYNPQQGLLNALLNALGLSHLAQGWLGQQNTALPALLVVSLWMRSGYYVVVYMAGIEGVPRDIWDVMRLEGVGLFRASVRVIVPMLRSVVAATAAMAVISSVNDFGMVWVMTRGGPVRATEILGTYMYKEAFTKFQMGYASSIVLLMLLIALFLGAAQIRALERGLVEY
jgi:raffinose/stachyose/melibiose transport system permease protein